MRIWHEQLIPKLCQKHLCAMWRESLGAYAIITGQVDGGSYKNHPAVKEFWNYNGNLYERLELIREEMLKRGYHPKPMPEAYSPMIFTSHNESEWQTLEQQIEVLKNKKCNCKI